MRESKKRRNISIFNELRTFLFKMPLQEKHRF